MLSTEFKKIYSSQKNPNLNRVVLCETAKTNIHVQHQIKSGLTNILLTICKNIPHDYYATARTGYTRNI